MPDRRTPASNYSLLLFASLLILALASSQSFSEIYKSKDEKGNVVFSDQPSPEADVVEVREPNTTAPVKVPEQPASPTEEDAETFKGYQLSISSPIDGTLIPNGLLGFNVTARITPALKEGHKIRLLINGKEYSRGTGSQFEVASIPRGKHQLQLIAIDEKGRKMGLSAPISINALRPSSAN